MGGSSKKQTVGYKYYVGMHMILSHGPVDKLLRIQVDERTAWQGSRVGTGPVAINSPNLFGGESREGGVSGALDFETGVSSQSRNSYLLSKLGSFVPAFRGVCGVVLRQMYMGMNPYLKSWSFRIQRVHVRQKGIPQWYDSKSAIFRRAYSQLNICFVLDGSGSMLEIVTGTTTRWDIQASEINEALDAFKGVTANLKVGVAIFGDPGNVYTLFKTISSAADIEALKSFVLNFPIVIPFGTYWAEGMQAAKDFFLWAGGIGEPVVIFTTDGDPTGLQTETNAAIAIRNSIPGVKVHVINIDLAQLTYSNQLDNTGGASVVTSTSSGTIRDTALAAVSEFFEYDMNPAHIIRECLTDPDWGMGYQDSDIDDASFEYAADILYSENMGMSLLWDTQSQIEEFVKLVVKHIDAAVYVERTTGKFVLKLIRNDYDQSTLITLNESNIDKVSDFSRPSFGELTNSVTVTYWNCLTDKDSTVTVQDIALQQMQGASIGTSISYPGFTTSDIATRVAQRDLTTLSTPLISCTIYANRGAKELNIGSCFKLDWPDYDVQGLVMRVTGIAFGDGKSNRIRIQCVQDVFALPEEAFVQPTTPDWEDPSQLPEAATVRQVFELPYLELVQQVGQANIDSTLQATPDVGYVAAAALRPGNALNAVMWDDIGSGYQEVGVLDFSPGAYLNGAISPTQTTFAIRDTQDIDQIVLGTWAQVDSEIIVVTAISDVSITVKRGCLDTLPEAHADGAALVFWDNYAFGDTTELVISEVAKVKLLTTSGIGKLELSAAPEDTITIVGRASKPYPPGNFKINSVPFGGVILGSADLSISWSHRDRLQQTGSEIYGQTQGDIGPEPGTTYTARIYGESDTLGRTQSGITGTSYSYPAATEQADFLIPYDAGPFDYSTFLSGVSGSAWLADAIHYQDTSRTTIANVGDGVGSFSSTGSTVHAGQGTASNKPTLQQASGKKYLAFDGLNDYLTADGGVSGWNFLHNASATAAYIAIAVNIAPANSNPNKLEMLLANFGVSSAQIGFSLFMDDRATASLNNAYRVFAARGSGSAVFDAQFNNTLPPQTDCVLEFIRSGNTWTLHKNGVQIGSGSYSSPTNSNASFAMFLGTLPDLSVFTDMNLYGMLVANKLPSAADRARIQGDMSSRCITPPMGTGTGFRVNGRLRIELESVRDGLTSFQKYSHEVRRDGYGFNYGMLYGGKP